MEGYATPIGIIPRYEDLRELFTKELQEDYTREQYEKQFVIRVPELLEKLQIVSDFYQKEEESHPVPQEIFKMIEIQTNLLKDAQRQWGDYIPPLQFKDHKVPEELAKPF